MRKILGYTCIGLTALVSLVPLAIGAGEPQKGFAEQRVRFARGEKTATLRGSVTQKQAMQYLVGAKAGQTLTVNLDSDAKTRFDLSGPKDKNGQAMADGATEWSGTLPDDGDYKIFVFTDDRDVQAPFTLKITIE